MIIFAILLMIVMIIALTIYLIRTRKIIIEIRERLDDFEKHSLLSKDIFSNRVKDLERKNTLMSQQK